jgi:hypothetical protein
LVVELSQGVVEDLNYFGEVVNIKNISIGKNLNPIKVKFTGKDTFDK